MSKNKQSSLSVTSYFHDAYTLMKDHYWILLINVIIYLVISIICGLSIVGVLAIGGIQLGYTKCWIKVARGEKVQLGDSLTYGFKKFRWLKAFGYIALSVLARLLALWTILCIGIMLLGSEGTAKVVFPAGLLSVMKILSTIEKIWGEGTYILIAAFALVVLFCIYLTIIWAYGLYFLAERDMTVRQMFSESHALVKKAGLCKVAAVFTIMFIISCALYSIPMMGNIILYVVLPYLNMVTTAIYVKNIKSVKKVQKH